MKKVLAMVLAAAMVLSLSAVAFAASYEVIGTVSGLSTGDKVYYVNSGFKGDADITKLIGTPLLTWGANDEVEFYFVISDKNDATEDYKITGLDAHINTNNVTVSTKRNGGIKSDPSSIKLKGATDGKDFTFDDDFNDIEIELDVDYKAYSGGKATGSEKNISFTMKADEFAAYSLTQYLEDDEDISISKSNGSIVKFDEKITEKTRIRCDEFVDVFFKGNYGTDKENMRVFTDEISEVNKYFDDEDVDVYDFAFNPKFASSVKVAIDCDANAIVYEYNKKTGDITKIDTDYESNAATFETKTLGCYIVTEEEYEDGNVKADGEEASSEEETNDGEKDNPGTGANDMVGAAAAMAVISLVAAGAVAFKKASK